MGPGDITVGVIYKGAGKELRKVTEITGSFQSTALLKPRWAEMRVHFKRSAVERTATEPLLDFARWAKTCVAADDVPAARFAPQGK